MSREPIYDTDFAETLAQAMDVFHEALTRRWREAHVRAVLTPDSAPHFPPSYINRPIAPYAPPPPELSGFTAGEMTHFIYHGCAYLDWVQAGQHGPLSSVVCSGETGFDAPTSVEGAGYGLGFDRAPYLGQTIPPTIRCPMGDNLRTIEDYAYGERNFTYSQLPLFDAHDLDALERAHDTFLDVGGELGLEARNEATRRSRAFSRSWASESSPTTSAPA